MKAGSTFCRLFVSLEVFASEEALESRRDGKSTKTVGTMKLLISVPQGEMVKSLFAKVQHDYGKKMGQKEPPKIKCRQILIDDCFEIVDIVHSPIGAYLTDMMHVTVLAVPFVAQVKAEIAPLNVGTKTETKAPESE